MQNFHIPILIFAFLSLTFCAGAQDFRVQIAAYGERMPAAFFEDKGVADFVETTDQMGVYRYFAGAYKTREEAEKVQGSIMEKGFPFATIIDLEEQRILCGQGCPYFRNGVIFVQDRQREATVRNIYFDFGRYSLTLESKEELQDVAQKMKENPALKLKLLGHTDAVGSAQANVQLATNRARSARNYLINKGIRADRMYIKVFGESEPAAPNALDDGEDIPENRKWNRRVVLTLIDEAGEVKTDKEVNSK
jgi:outer membrane protein OmpA-like peptidoglycan-associated protein